MNKEAVLNHLKQTRIPLPGLIIVIIWLLTSYFLYPQKIQKPEVKGIADSKVGQVKLVPTVTPTPEISKPTPTIEVPSPTSIPPSTNSSAPQNASPSDNSASNIHQNDSNTVPPTPFPSSDITPDVTNPTSTPQPTPNEPGNATPAPTAVPQPNQNNAPDNNVGTTVSNLAQALPIGLNIPK